MNQASLIILHVRSYRLLVIRHYQYVFKYFCFLSSDLLERTQSLEDTSRHLADFNENLRELIHELERCEDKLASHDALGGAAKDPKLLDRIKVSRMKAIAVLV